MAEFWLTVRDGYVGMSYNHLPLSMPEAADVAEANPNDGMAANNHAWCLFNGIGTPKQQKLALKMWRKAADKGNAGASYNLAYCYMFGIVVKQDDQMCSDFFAKYHRCRVHERQAFINNQSVLQQMEKEKEQP
uniref:Sel1 repeat family protein n=1 Tax=Hemiselmis tepida TaxID=464990 RepID=A0A7S0V0P9_9CRYP|mmetsp:Transcript_10588/g.27505  ORF Transcript_10588/g.27505 Transcript_10588/m.27505 type:complete len:133 (+) Transcript_10588:66-464(+)|eukprot:CAMPEP_0174924574 /NCGR_PEP_ID=MMETSP1355-20121228/7333_1 /TAXON_ID=464990 /ORGANISM="Hemiselmis tepida, Strain CCMP443" /LENGTH=132 /DNA_ID=CAMNT_0016170391 /DNA_START=29 /DNA_END=427 /DNA_ORIENTATION=-